jgi:hypothetical protein
MNFNVTTTEMYPRTTLRERLFKQKLPVFQAQLRMSKNSFRKPGDFYEIKFNRTGNTDFLKNPT